METFYNSLLKQKKKMRKLGAAFRNWLMFTPNLGDMIQLDPYFKGNLRKGEVTLVSFLGVCPVDVLTVCQRQ